MFKTSPENKMVEVLTGAEQRRRRTPQEKIAIVQQSMEPGTCRLNGIVPEAYLRHILSVLPEWPSNKVAELLPWNVVLTDK